MFGWSFAICVRWDLDWVLIVTHFEAVHCVNSVGSRRRSSGYGNREPVRLACWLAVEAGEPCSRWQGDDRPWITTSHYIRSGSAPLIGARLGISSVVPSSKETFFWATAQMSATPPGPMPCHACAFWVSGGQGGLLGHSPMNRCKGQGH